MRLWAHIKWANRKCADCICSVRMSAQSSSGISSIESHSDSSTNLKSFRSESSSRWMCEQMQYMRMRTPDRKMATAPMSVPMIKFSSIDLSIAMRTEFANLINVKICDWVHFPLQRNHKKRLSWTGWWYASAAGYGRMCAWFDWGLCMWTISKLECFFAFGELLDDIY